MSLNLQFDINFLNSIVIYTLKGKIVSEHDFEDLEREVFENLNKNFYRIIFDLSELTHTNSSGIGFFMRTLTKSRIMEGDLVLTHLKGNVKKIFEIAKLDEVYTIYTEEEKAIKHFK